MPNTNSMTEVLAELLKRLDNVGSKSGKEERGDKIESKAGIYAGRKGQISQRLA